MATTSDGDCTFGSMISLRRSPAFPTTLMRSNVVHLVSHALTRTHITRSPQSWLLIASTTLGRAASFSNGDTASSRSRNVMSAGIVGPFASIFSLEPGTDRQERRGRSRERADMAPMLRVGLLEPPECAHGWVARRCAHPRPRHLATGALCDAAARGDGRRRPEARAAERRPHALAARDVRLAQRGQASRRPRPAFGPRTR